MNVALRLGGLLLVFGAGGSCRTPVVPAAEVVEVRLRSDDCPVAFLPVRVDRERATTDADGVARLEVTPGPHAIEGTACGQRWVEHFDGSVVDVRLPASSAPRLTSPLGVGAPAAYCDFPVPNQAARLVAGSWRWLHPIANACAVLMTDRDGDHFRLEPYGPLTPEVGAAPPAPTPSWFGAPFRWLGKPLSISRGNAFIGDRLVAEGVDDEVFAVSRAALVFREGERFVTVPVARPWERSAAPRRDGHVIAIRNDARWLAVRVPALKSIPPRIFLESVDGRTSIDLSGARHGEWVRTDFVFLDGQDLHSIWPEHREDTLIAHDVESFAAFDHQVLYAAPDQIYQASW